MIKHKKTNRNFLAVLFPALLISVFIIGCKNDPKEVMALTGNGNIITQDRGEDVTIIYSERGKVKARFFSHEYIGNDDAKPPYMEGRKGIKVEFFNDSGVIQSTLTAKYARYYEQQNNVLVRDSVVVTNIKGETLNTQELVWNQKAGKFFTEKPVRITTATQQVFGDGMEANQDFSTYKITNFKGTLDVKKSEMPK